MERTFPLHSPKIEKIDVAARGDVRRAKLYYLRERVGRRARVRERRWTGADEVTYEAGAMPPDDAPRPGEEELAATVEPEDAAGESEPAPQVDGAPADQAAAVEAEPESSSHEQAEAREPAADSPSAPSAGESSVADSLEDGDGEGARPAAIATSPAIAPPRASATRPVSEADGHAH